MDTQLRDSVAALLLDAGRAHHEAYEATGGADPEWPIWYADFLQRDLASALGRELSKSQLIYCLMSADFDYQARSPNADWPEFYANELVARYSPAGSAHSDRLALYYMEGCPFCNRVRATIERLGIEVELRNVVEDPVHREDLMKVRGRATVPVLRISNPEGNDRWMPESQDIDDYLKKTYA